MERNSGFSLVELIVVIAIMAILVGVAVPVYTSYVDKAQETVDDQYLSDVVYAAQLYAAEKGLELHSIAIAPQVDAGNKQGIELFLTETDRVADLTELYAMIGSHTFKDAAGSTVHYYTPAAPEEGDPKEENHTHDFKPAKQETCLEDGYKQCACGATEIIPATGHATGDEFTQVGNLKIYTCTHEGCNYKVVKPEGSLIG